MSLTRRTLGTQWLGENPRSKALVFLALLVTTSISTTVIALSIKPKYNTVGLVDWVRTSRATIQIIVHLLSATLAALQLYALSGFVSFRINLRLLAKPMSLDTLKLHQAMSIRKLDFDLPLQFFVISLVYAAVVQAPGALWAGAITPVLNTANVTALYKIPFYNESVIATWGASCRPGASGASCNASQTTTQQGTFTNVPWRFMTGLLLNSVRDASSRNTLTPQHNKLDKSGYSFYGRSYGVASGVGMIDPPSMTVAQDQQEFTRIKNYSFSESGYDSRVRCALNESSNLYFQDLKRIDGGTQGAENFTGSVMILQAGGSLPTGAWTGFTTMSIVDNQTAFALAAVYDDTRYFYGLLPGRFYPNLMNVQCEVNFSPASFDVMVDVQAKNISVTPRMIDTPQVNIDSTGGLVNNTFVGLSFLSQILTTMYTGVLSDAFTLNVQAVQNREHHATVTESDVTTGVAESLELLLDEYFGAIAASQSMLWNQTKPVSATMKIEVVQLGEPVYAYVTFAINLTILILLLYESFRTGFWKDLPRMNCLDAKCAILGAARAVRGTELPREARRWEGDAADRQAGTLEVRLRANKPALELLSPTSEGLASSVDTTNWGVVPLVRLESYEDVNVSQGDRALLL